MEHGTPRDLLERRLRALTDDFLDRLFDEHERFDLGVVGFAVEVLTPSEPDQLRRSEGGYTPAEGTSSVFRYYCSDNRSWAKRAMFEDNYSYLNDLNYWGEDFDDNLDLEFPDDEADEE